MTILAGSGIAGTLNPDLFRFSSGGSAYYPNPMYRHIHTFIPANLLELFAWCEYIYNNSPQLATSIRRFAEYPITEVEYPVENKYIKNYKEYFDYIDLKEVLISCGIDFHVYGNAFLSPYYPFIRMVTCSGCSKDFNAENVKLKVDASMKFILECPECRKKGPAKVKDKKIKDPKGLKWIQWNPKNIEIEYNEISGKTKYLLKVPNNIVQGVKTGNLHIINSTPLEIISAVKADKRFCFSDDSIYHLKANTPTGFIYGWGFPMLTQALYEVLHIAVLKRANEAIAWEHIVPRLLVSPAPSGTAGDPLKHVSMARWKSELMKSKDKWNKDPNYIMYAPFPINVQQLGGNGRALMVSAEIEAAEKNLAMALGIPLEFAAGTLAWQTSAMSLRLLKNQMHTMVSRLERMLQWMVDTTAKYLSWPSFKASLEPFELADDEVRKQFLLQLNASGKISDNTLFTALGLDYEEEVEKVKDEQISLKKKQDELQQEMLKEQKSITQQAKRQEIMQSQSGSAGSPGDIDSLNQQAQQVAEMLLPYPPQQRNEALAQLKMKSFPFYAMVKEHMEVFREALEGQAAAMQAQQSQEVAQSQTMGGVQNSVMSNTQGQPQVPTQ